MPPRQRIKRSDAAGSPPVKEGDDFPYQHLDFPPVRKMLAAVAAAAAQQPLLQLPDPFAYTADARVDRDFPADFYAADGLSSHFTEPARMRCVFRGGESPSEAWAHLREWYAGADREEAFEAVYARARPCNTFNPTLGAAFYIACARALGTSQLDVLDPSAGWGDRLVAAHASRVVATYTAADPNPDLVAPHRRLRLALADADTRPPVLRSVVIHPEPFEALVLDDESFDVVFTSPPYFTLENYEPRAAAGSAQSTDTHRGYRNWVAGFLRPLVYNSARALRPRGFFALYIENVRANGKLYPLLDDASLIARAAGLVPAGRVGFSMAEDGSERRTRFITIWRTRE